MQGSFWTAQSLLDALCDPTGRHIKEAEEQILKLIHDDNFALSLLITVAKTELTIPHIKSALSIVKRVVDTRWRVEPDNKEKAEVSKEVKTQIREIMFTLYIKCCLTEGINKLIKKILYNIVYSDYPNDWPEFPSLCLELITRGLNFTEIYGGLCGIDFIALRYTHVENKKRGHLFELLQAFSPVLQKLYESLEALNSQETKATSIFGEFTDICAIITRKALKIQSHCSRVRIPTLWKENVEYYKLYYSMALWVLNSQIPEELLTLNLKPGEEKLREKHPKWKLKKEAMSNLFKLLTRDCREPKKSQSKQKKIYEFASMNVFVRFPEASVMLIQASNQFYISRPVMMISLRALLHSVKFYPQLCEYFRPKFLSLVLDDMLKFIYLTAEEIELFASEDIEYIRRDEDDSYGSGNLRNVVADIIELVQKYPDTDGEIILLKILDFCARCFQDGKNPRNGEVITLHMKEALLNLFRYLSKSVLEIKGINQNIETILQRYIIPEFSNTEPLIRLRTCFVIHAYSHIQFQDQQIIGSLLAGLGRCMMEEKFPIRLKATKALCHLCHQPLAKELAKAELPNILKILIQLIDKIDDEDLFSDLNELTKIYKEEVKVYSVEIVNALSNYYFKTCSSNEEADIDDEMEKGFSSVGAIDAIYSLVDSNLPPESYYQLFNILSLFFRYVVSEAGLEHVDSAMSILNIILYKLPSLTTEAWNLYPLICYSIIGTPNGIVFYKPSDYPGLRDDTYDEDLIRKTCKDGWAYEQMPAFSPVLKNYISKGGECFLEAVDAYGNNLVDLLIKVSTRVFKREIISSEEDSGIAMTQILRSLVENYPMKIRRWLSSIIELCYEMLHAAIKTRRKLSVELVQVLMLSIWNDVEFSLQYLREKNYFIEIMKILMGDSDYYGSAVCTSGIFMGAITILSLGENFPNEIPILPFMKEILKLVKKINHFREEQNKILENEETEHDSKTKNIKDLIKYAENLEDNDIGGDTDSGEDGSENPFCDSENPYYENPFDKIDELAVFQEQLKRIQHASPAFFEKMISCYTPEEVKELEVELEYLSHT